MHKVGIVALQGAVGLHAEALRALGAAPVEVRTPSDLAGVEGLVLPGGESTTLSKLLESSGLFDEIAGLLADGMPAFGTCAGMILLANDVLDGRPDQRSFAAIDVSVRRNAFGRQVDSFETSLDRSTVWPGARSRPSSSGRRWSSGWGRASRSSPWSPRRRAVASPFSAARATSWWPLSILSCRATCACTSTS